MSWGAGLSARIVRRWFSRKPSLLDPPSAADALTFAVPRLRRRDFNDVATIDGNYLRRSDAELFAKHNRGLATDKTE